MVDFAVVSRASTPLSFFLDAGEQAVVGRVLDFLRTEAPDQAAIAEESLDRLAATARLLDDSPSITSSWQERRRSSEALIDLLCRVPDYDLDLHIPTRAVLGQAYLVVKINFLKALSYALENIEGAGDLDDEVQSGTTRRAGGLMKAPRGGLPEMKGATLPGLPREGSYAPDLPREGDSSPPNGSTSCRFSSSSWSRMYARIFCSSRPTVLTQ